ncbi:MAG: hypothetical protein LBI34_02635 [Puniceicoccales bacterium]|jgi:hypothetical protein|nr:hypothetical protein [Puniceicoccales bacterium]
MSLMVQLNNATWVASMDSSQAKEILGGIGGKYIRGDVTSINFLKTVAGVVVTLGPGPRNNVAMQIRFLLMTESLPPRVEHFANDLCEKLDELLKQEVEAEEYKVKEELEKARKAFYDAQTAHYTSEGASITAEIARKKAQKDLEAMDKKCLLL